MKLSIIPGTRYGYLTVVSEESRSILPSGQSNRIFKCKCDCGNETNVRLLHLVRFRIKSCGCTQGEQHRSSKTKLYRVWRGIKERCYYSKHKHYSNYGGRGITMCEEWRLSFNVFKQWAISNGWQKGLQIDRKDNNGNYEPSNCRFVTREVNINNRAITVKVEYEGQTRVLIELLREKNLANKYDLIKRRIVKLGMTPKAAIEKPIRSIKCSTILNDLN